MINVPTRVKDALKSGMYPKNHRIVVLNEDDTELFTIDNTSLVDGSVSYDERLCTGDTLKFGLCEGSSLQFQYFGHESILGRRLQCFIDAQYKDADGELKYFEIPMGFYDVEQCPMQFDTGIKKVTAYNKLKSAYLDADVTEEMIQIIKDGDGSTSGIALRSVVDTLFGDYSIYRDDYKFPSMTGGASSFSLYPIYLDKFKGDKHATDGYVCVYCSSVSDRNYIYDGDFYRFFVNQYLVDFLDEIKKEDGLIEDEQATYKWRSDSSSTYKPWSFYEKTDKYITSDELSSLRGMQIGIRVALVKDNPYPQEMTFKATQDIYNYIKEEGTGTFKAYESSYYTNIDGIRCYMPLIYNVNGRYTESELFALGRARSERFENIWLESFELYKKNMSEIESKHIYPSSISDNSKATLRELQSSIFEIDCEFGQLNRYTDLFTGVQLNNERLFPSESLYPSDNLYPGGKAEHIMRSNYEKLWTDAQGIQKFKELIITYKGLNAEGQEEEKTLTRTIDADGTQNYNMSDNWLFKNLVWTAEEVGHYADAMVEKMRNVTWFPFEMWAAGLPYIETGDELEITTQNGTYTSYVLTRTLNGIHDLHDTYINGTLDVF